MSISYFILMPILVSVLAFSYNFLWKVIHEYMHLAALKLLVGKELYSYKINLKSHYLGTDRVSASITWKARELTTKEHGLVAIAPHVVEFFACLCFMFSSLFLINDFMRQHFYMFFMWATFWLGGVIDLIAAANADTETSDLNVFADCYEIERFEVQYTAWTMGYLSILAGMALIWVIL